MDECAWISQFKKNHSTLLIIFHLRRKSINHKSVFVNKIISNHDNENLTKNRAETKNLYDVQPKNIFMLKNSLTDVSHNVYIIHIIIIYSYIIFIRV